MMMMLRKIIHGSGVISYPCMVGRYPGYFLVLCTRDPRYEQNWLEGLLYLLHSSVWWVAVCVSIFLVVVEVEEHC